MTRSVFPVKVINFFVGPIKAIFGIAVVFVILTSVTFGFIWRKDIAAMFNYPSVYGDLLSDAAKKLFKTPAARQADALPMPKIQLVPSAGRTLTEGDASDSTYILSIPALNITAPLLISESQEPEHIESLLKRGVVVYPSSQPGQKGTTIILGHSAPAGWPKINYDWIFGEIHELKNGDVINISSPTGSYSYRVTKKMVLKKGEDIPLSYETDGDSAIILLTCWPPGIDYKRMAVQAELLTDLQ